MKVLIGTENPGKIQGAREAFEKYFDNIEIEGISVSSEVGDQPVNEDILSGFYPLDSKLPTEVELAEKYKVSRSTVRQALELLVNDGIISKRWGSGNTVISKSDSSKKNTVMVLLPESKSTAAAALLNSAPT